MTATVLSANQHLPGCCLSCLAAPQEALPRAISCRWACPFGDTAAGHDGCTRHHAGAGGVTTMVRAEHTVPPRCPKVALLTPRLGAWLYGERSAGRKVWVGRGMRLDQRMSTEVNGPLSSKPACREAGAGGVTNHCIDMHAVMLHVRSLPRSAGVRHPNLSRFDEMSHVAAGG